MRSLHITLVVVFVLCHIYGRAEDIGDLRVYECVMVAQPPKIDGRLDDSCWRQAEEANSFTCTLTSTGKPPSAQTYFRILYDEKNLYIAVRCDEPHPEKIKANITEDDNPSVCGDDCIEIFCQPDSAVSEYYQFVVNPRGTRYDGRKRDASWNGHWQAATLVGKDAWFVEVAIALDSLPNYRGVWRFNINREMRSTEEPEFQCWSNTYGPFHSPDRFGYLFFAGPFANLRRGYLVQAGRYALSTLQKQTELDTQRRAIRAMCESVSQEVVAPFKKLLTELDRDREALTHKYAALKDPTISDWETFDRDLDFLLLRSQKVYWELKFHVLLND